VSPIVFYEALDSSGFHRMQRDEMQPVLRSSRPTHLSRLHQRGSAGIRHEEDQSDPHAQGQRHGGTDPAPPERDVPECAGADGVLSLYMHETLHREALVRTDLKAGVGHGTRYR
jgi:hypothetical protein